MVFIFSLSITPVPFFLLSSLLLCSAPLPSPFPHFPLMIPPLPSSPVCFPPSLTLDPSTVSSFPSLMCTPHTHTHTHTHTHQPLCRLQNSSGNHTDDRGVDV